MRSVLRIRPFRRLWLVLGLASFGDWIGLLATGIFAAAQFQSSAGQGAAFGGTIAVRLLPSLFLGPIAGVFADRFDRKKFLLFFYAGFVVGTLLCGVAQSYKFLLVARIVTGVFGGVIGSISFAIIADLFPLSMRGRVMGLVQTSFAGSQIMGIPIGLFLHLVCIATAASAANRLNSSIHHMRLPPGRPYYHYPY